MMAYPALNSRNFRLFLVAGFISNIGTWMQNVARSWVIYKETGDDPRWLGWLGLSFAIPMVILPLVGGTIVDRVPRIKLVLVTQTGLTLVAVALAVLAWTGLLAPWHLLASTFAGAIFLAIDNPARQAIAPDLVPREDLLNALSLNAASFNGAALLGPALAGPLLGRIGAGWLFFMNAASFLFMIAAIASLRDLPDHAHKAPPKRAGAFREALGSHGVVALLVISAVAAVFGRSYPMLLPIVAAHVWNAGSSGYGRLLAAGGAGALVGGFGTASFPALRASSRVITSSGLVLAVSLALFARTTSQSFGLACLVLAGASSTVLTTAIATSLQHAIKPEARGRIMSLYVITLIGLPQLVAPLLANGAHHFVDAHEGVAAVLYVAAALLAVSMLTTHRRDQ
ncbi:MAG: MFS transporter [Polyangiaceae bacterium]